MSKIYIHYGHDSFNFEEFTPVETRKYVNKPFGGLWASPEDSSNSWKHFVISEFPEWGLGKLDIYFKFTLSKDAKVLKIKSLKDLTNLPKIKSPKFFKELDLEDTLDFNYLKENWDALELTLTPELNTFNLFYGWDVDSLLVFNPNIIEEVL